MIRKIKWVMVEVGDGASEEHAGECTTFSSAGEQSVKVTITNTLGKATNVTLIKDGPRVTVCDDTGVATVEE
jgi:hypothetical protein